MRHRINRLAIGSWLFVMQLSPGVWAEEPIPPEAEPPADRSEEPVAAEPTAPAEEAAEAPADAPAEEAEATAETPEAQTGGHGDIYVTGSRIRSSFGRATAPVEVVDRLVLDARGGTNLADAVQYLTAAQGSGIEGGVGPGGVAQSTASNINLRGLGVGTTLLLINGRRINPTGYATYGGFSDFSLVPMAAVERIDILKAGASAIYGADAVGGVVNIITRRAWNGLRLEFDDKATQNFDLNEYNASAAFGAGFDRGRVMAASAYFRRNSLMASERDFPPDKYTRPNGYPGSFSLGATTAPDPACGTPSAPGSMLIGTAGMPPTGCQTTYRDDATLLSNAERVNAFASGEFDLSDHATAYGELVVSRFRGDQAIPMLAINPPPVNVPADHIDNPFHQAVTYRAAPGPGRHLISSSDDSFRGVLGVKGDFGALPVLKDWQWDVSAMLGISRFLRTIDDNLRTPLQTALNSCSDPTHLDNCFNPFFSATDGTGTANSKTVIERIRGREIEIQDHALQSYNAGISGSLLELPGGDLGLAVGAEIRREWLVVDLDHAQNTGELLSIGLASDFVAERKTYSGYVELRAPIVDWFEFQTAARVEYYTDTERAAISPFAGINITPIEGLLLRGNLSRSFRAPRIADTYPGSVGIPTYVRLNNVYSLAVANYAGNATLKPETALTLSGGLQWSLKNVLRLSADYWYYDFVDRIQSENAQVLVDGWAAQGMPASSTKVSIDPATNMVSQVFSTRINVPGSIITSGVDFGITTGIDGTTFGGKADDFGRISLGVQGTYTFNYTVPRAQAAPAQRTKCDGETDDAACNLVGARNADTSATGSPPSLPRLKLNVPLSWSLAQHTFSLIGHVTSGVRDDVVADVGTYSDGGEIPAWVTLDLQYSFTLPNVIGKALTLRLGCENLLDKRPPYINGVAVGYLGDLHDPRGRLLYAKLSADF